MIETRVYIGKPTLPRKRLRFIRLIMVAIFIIGFIMPMPSTAAPGTNSFTGSTSVNEIVLFTCNRCMKSARLYHTATLLNNGKVLVAGGYGGSNYLNSAELYDPVTDTWRTAGKMSNARGYHTATLLNNGKVLVAGGRDGSGYLRSAELYDPVTDTWSTAGNMNSARLYHTATLLNNGKVLVAGGDGSSNTLSSAELYDPVTGTWSTAGNMSNARGFHTATLLNNGKVLVAGGSGSGNSPSSAELYDPVTGSWSTAGNMNRPRFYHTATLLNNGKVLVTGGSGSGNSPSSAELYDPVTGSWSNAGNMSSARYGHTATLLNNGKVLVAGGIGSIDGPSSAELYNPVTDTWSAAGNMSSARQNHTATLLNNDKVLVTGGYGNGYLNSADLFDSVSGTWSTIGNMSSARYGHTATLLNNGKVLVAGGYGGSNYLNSAELYDPVTDTWSTAGNMNSGRADHTATLLNNGKVLVAGGRDGSGYLRSAELYDPVAGTWNNAGNMSNARGYYTATLLNNGKVLVTGGSGSGNNLSSAELYDPVTGTWNTAGNMNSARVAHTATLLNNGKVLVLGGAGSGDLSAELFSPVMGTWSATGNMSSARGDHTATLLNNDKVLIAGGYGNSNNLSSAELYDPEMGTWSNAGNMSNARRNHTATLLNNGKVLVAGGYGSGNSLSSEELYDPVIGAWSTAGNMNSGRADHTATLLNNGKVLIAGGINCIATGGCITSSSAELGTLIPGNTFTGTLTLPSGWLNSTTISAQFVGTSSAAAINAGALSNDNTTWGNWVPATSGDIITTTWDVGSQGANKPVFLRLRDIDNQETTVVNGTVNVDLTKPSSSMTALPAISPANILLSWSGSDALSGLSTYDVQVRAGTGGTWTNVLNGTTNISTDYIGANGLTYYFRTRASDIAGNVEDWPADYDTYTLVDAVAPNGTVVVNSGALTTTAINVTLSLSANDALSGVAQMSFSNDGSAWSVWQLYATQASWSLLGGDGIKDVYARFRDIPGNISLSVSDSIILDTTTDTEYGLTINDGAIFTNQTSVALTIGAKPGTSQMQVSNDGGFSGAFWEPYTSHKAWTITQYGSYIIPRVVYIRYKDINGNVSSNYQDDIILDVTPPTGSVSIASAAGFQAMASGVTLLLSATDDVSGVGQMLISNQPDFSGAIWEAFATSRSWVLGSNGTVYVRFRDNAGNISTTYWAGSPPKWSIFLPLIHK